MIPVFNIHNVIEFEFKLGRKFLYSPSSKISHICIYDASLSDASEIKLFIRDIYKKYYDADIVVSYPYLMAVHDRHNNILAAVGFRFAVNNHLFLEQYFDQPIQDVVSEKYHQIIARSQIVEIGSLASRGGVAKFLFLAIAGYLQKMGYSYVAMTGTSNLRKNFSRLNLKPKIICKAKSERLTDVSQNWGSYYDSRPKVMVGNIKTGFATLQKVLKISLNYSLTKLYPHE